MPERKVFLSGAIEGVEDYGRQWRKEASLLLEQSGYQVIDPMSVQDPNYSNPQEIVYRNLFMQNQADILLVEYMIPNRNYVGTDFELCWAKNNEQPSIVFSCKENAGRVYLNYLASKVTSSMEEAVNYLVEHYR
jgi:hypothetical protein